MCPVIRVTPEIYSRLENLAIGFDSPSNVMLKLLDSYEGKKIKSDDLSVDFNNPSNVILGLPDSYESKKTKNSYNSSAESGKTKRLFGNNTNTEIQKRLASIVSKLPLEELKQFEDKDFTKEKFGINFALIVKVPVYSNEEVKKEAVQDHRGRNRWTWKYEFDRDGFSYAICTQWFRDNDKYVGPWLMEHGTDFHK